MKHSFLAIVIGGMIAALIFLVTQSLYKRYVDPKCC